MLEPNSGRPICVLPAAPSAPSRRDSGADQAVTGTPIKLHGARVLGHRAARSFRGAIERDVELEHVDPRLTQHPKRAPFGVFGNETTHLLGCQSACFRNPRELRSE